MTHADSLHASAAAALTAYVPADPTQAHLRDHYLRLLHRDPDAVWRRARPAHLTAGAVVVDPAGEHTLLVLHNRVRRWLQPGGHCEDGDRTLRDTAMRECREETGLAAFETSAAPLVLSRHGAPCGAREHFDVQYLVVAPADAATAVSEESLDVGWFPVDALPEPLADGVAANVTVAAAAVRRA